MPTSLDDELLLRIIQDVEASLMYSVLNDNFPEQALEQFKASLKATVRERFTPTGDATTDYSAIFDIVKTEVELENENTLKRISRFFKPKYPDTLTG